MEDSFQQLLVSAPETHLRLSRCRICWKTNCLPTAQGNVIVSALACYHLPRRVGHSPPPLCAGQHWGSVVAAGFMSTGMSMRWTFSSGRTDWWHACSVRIGPPCHPFHAISLITFLLL
eukprot:SAG11_NODE_637_length_8033_cov_4.585707_12_plen_118_part_00